MRKQNITALFAFLFAFISFTKLSARQTIDGFEAPESVLKSGDKIFVSNIGGAQPNPMAKDANGFISELSAEGKILNQKFQKGILNGPKGMAVINDILYVADIDRVVGFNKNSGEQVFDMNITGATFLNDLCAAGDNMLAVSESMQNKVYLVNTSDKTSHFAGSVAGANGVAFNAKTKQLFASGMGIQMNGTGKLYVKNVNDKDTVFTELQNSPAGIFDGLEMMDEDHLLASDWINFNGNKGRLVVYDLKSHTNTVYPVDAGPADICYDKTSAKVYIPQMPANTILITAISNLKKE